MRDVDDVLTAVELVIAGRPGIDPPVGTTRAAAMARAEAATAPIGPLPGPSAGRVLQALDHDPASLDTVVRRCRLPLADVAEALEQLAAVGLAAGAGGWWSRISG